MVNGQWLIVMSGYPNATLCHSERSEESRGEKNEILRFALNDKLIVNGQWLIVMSGYPNANFANGANGRSTYHVPGMTIDN